MEREKNIGSFICKSNVYHRIELTHADIKVEITRAKDFLSRIYPCILISKYMKGKGLEAPHSRCRTPQPVSKDMCIISKYEVIRNTENHPF